MKMDEMTKMHDSIIIHTALYLYVACRRPMTRIVGGARTRNLPLCSAQKRALQLHAWPARLLDLLAHVCKLSIGACIQSRRYFLLVYLCGRLAARACNAHVRGGVAHKQRHMLISENIHRSADTAELTIYIHAVHYSLYPYSGYIYYVMRKLASCGDRTVSCISHFHNKNIDISLFVREITCRKFGLIGYTKSAGCYIYRIE